MAATCSNCGRSITWAKLPDGKNFALQKMPAFDVTWTRNDHGAPFEREYQAHAVKIESETYVSHFQICPKEKKK